MQWLLSHTRSRQGHMESNCVTSCYANRVEGVGILRVGSPFTEESAAVGGVYPPLVSSVGEESLGR